MSPVRAVHIAAANLKEDTMSIQKAAEKEITRFLAEHSGWELREGKLHREFAFADFLAAFSFMTQAALAAERANHHPEWYNVYNRVEVDLTTHEADGITSRDFDLAQEMDRIADGMV
jgi:4a-hydroxytetrahydrobiopterin dehydratase